MSFKEIKDKLYDLRVSYKEIGRFIFFTTTNLVDFQVCRTGEKYLINIDGKDYWDKTLKEVLTYIDLM